MIKIREFLEPIRSIPANSVVRLGDKVVNFHGLRYRNNVVQARISDDEGTFRLIDPVQPVHYISTINDYRSLGERP